MAKSLNEDLNEFLDVLCVRYGFCSIPKEERLRLVSAPYLTAYEFAITVLRGDGFADPEAEIHWMRTLQRLFVERFGSPSITAEEFEAEERG